MRGMPSTREQSASTTGERAGGSSGLWPVVRGTAFRTVNRRLVTGWLLNLPALAILGFVLLTPAVIALWFSLRQWDGVTPSTFVGLDNFRELAGSDRFWNSVRANVALAVLTLVTQVPLAFALAVVLFRRRHKTGPLRVLVFFPHVLSIGAAGLLWLMIYRPERGLLNSAVNLVVPGDVTVSMLSSPSTALMAVVLATNWYYFGLHTLIFIAGMSAIPADYYDIVRISSSKIRDELRYVTVPLLREQFLVSFILVISGSFGHILGFVAILTNGGPSGSTELLGLYSIDLGFGAAQYGMASAVTVVLLAIVSSAVIWPIARIARTRLEYL